MGLGWRNPFGLGRRVNRGTLSGVIRGELNRVKDLTSNSTRLPKTYSEWKSFPRLSIEI